jgi:hypothetical protein
MLGNGLTSCPRENRYSTFRKGSRLKTSTTSAVRRLNTFSIVGATIGLLLFLAVALVPSLLYGGVAGVQVANGVFGAPNASELGVNAFIVLGIVCAVATVSSLSVALGAAAGAFVDVLTRATPRSFSRPSPSQPSA